MEGIAMNTTQVFVSILMMVIATQLTRWLPFLIFPEQKAQPKWLNFLSERLPYASLGLLVMYALKDVQLTRVPYGVSELISLSFITVIHTKYHNTLLSIGLGSLLYLILFNFVF
ncbi:MAG TPA: branched-chain amino acid transporter AzlD [Erysipelotrichaceae bacterium]|nr:branched-chain amino acid transporter AzlD [Erysipelotrichaceae bacterium]